MKSIWWIKRDIRIKDNEALVKAIKNSTQVLPIFVFEPSLINAPESSAFHLYAQIEALKDLKKNIQTIGGDILIARGEVIDVFTSLKKKYNLKQIFSHEETGSNITFVRDKKIKKWCQKNNVIWHEYYQNGAIRRLSSRDDRQPIIKKRLLQTPLFKIPELIPFPQNFSSICRAKKIPELNEYFGQKDLKKIDFTQTQKVSETDAWKDFRSFLNDRGYRYSRGISSPNTAFTHGSRLSVHLAWGSISLRSVFQHTLFKLINLKKSDQPSAKKWSRSLLSFQSRLHWHCHFIQRLESDAPMEFQAINPAYRNLEYKNDTQKLSAWLNGQTGFPMVDACMRCLQATGFLNFRMRAMVVSFAIFGLHLSWKKIQYPLAQVFLDYEPGIHLSQIQMQSGIIGINTIRVYSPRKQIEDQDPNAVFIKKWIPELRSYTSTEIIAHEQYPIHDYVSPIIDFKSRSKAMKDQIFGIRKSLEGKLSVKKVLTKHGSRKTKSKTKTKVTKNDQLSLSI
jgi:deoxyribodipyrimidine photo-lyase